VTIVIRDRDRLLEHRGGHPRRGLFDQLQDEGTADATTHDVECPDAQMIEQRQLVVREGSPRICDVQRSGRPTGVALVHGDEPEVLAVESQRVYRRTRPHLDGRVHGTWGDEQQWKPSAVLLVVDRRLSVIESRHPQTSRTGPELAWG
jgi:hypothetical protein